MVDRDAEMRRVEANLVKIIRERWAKAPAVLKWLCLEIERKQRDADLADVDMPRMQSCD